MSEAPIKTKEKTNDTTIDHKKQLAEEFLKTVESKLKKSEKDTWMFQDHDHLSDHKKK